MSRVLDSVPRSISFFYSNWALFVFALSFSLAGYLEWNASLAVRDLEMILAIPDTYDDDAVTFAQRHIEEFCRYEHESRILLYTVSGIFLGAALSRIIIEFMNKQIFKDTVNSP